jgi:hypothetical protein
MHDTIEFSTEPHGQILVLDRLYCCLLLSPPIDTQTEAIECVAGRAISTDRALGCWKTAFVARNAMA